VLPSPLGTYKPTKDLEVTAHTEYTLLSSSLSLEHNSSSLFLVANTSSHTKLNKCIWGFLKAIFPFSAVIILYSFEQKFLSSEIWTLWSQQSKISLFFRTCYKNLNIFTSVPLVVSSWVAIIVLYQYWF